MSDKPSIPQVRQRIDQIDDTILELLKCFHMNPNLLAADLTH